MWRLQRPEQPSSRGVTWCKYAYSDVKQCVMKIGNSASTSSWGGSVTGDFNARNPCGSVSVKALHDVSARFRCKSVRGEVQKQCVTKFKGGLWWLLIARNGRDSASVEELHDESKRSAIKQWIVEFRNSASQSIGVEVGVADWLVTSTRGSSTTVWQDY